MLNYKVTDLDRFFLVFPFEARQEQKIQQRYESGDTLHVFQDGSVVWGMQEELVPADEEGGLADDEAFEKEAARCDSVALADIDDNEEEFAGALLDEEEG